MNQNNLVRTFKMSVGMVLFLLTLLFAELSRAQDLENLLMKGITDPVKGNSKSLETKGVIGDKGQEIRVEFVSMIRNADRPDEYLVYGHTEVERNICDFQGIMKVKNPGQGIDTRTETQPKVVEGSFIFYEDKDQKHTGILRGEFEMQVPSDEKSAVVSGHFHGKWHSYESGEVLDLSWAVEAGGLLSEASKISASKMNLGAFSVSLSVKELEDSKAFWEKLGFVQTGGDVTQNWVVLRNGETVIGLFKGMFEGNWLTFNPGWNQQAQSIEPFEDVRVIQARLKERGVTLTTEADETTTGPAFIMLTDPDGNVILVDQHR